MSKRLKNWLTSIFNSKNFSGGYTPGPPLKREGKGKRWEGEGGKGRSWEGKGYVMAVGRWMPL